MGNRGPHDFPSFVAPARRGGASGAQELPGEPSFYRSLATADAKIDAATAASMISGYRSNNGLTSVTIDPELMKLAEAQAQALAGQMPRLTTTPHLQPKAATTTG